MTIIEQIKTEIENLIEKYGSVKAKGVLQEGYKGGRLIGYEDALNILKRIQEESERQMNQDELEKEAVNYCFDNGLNLSPRVATDFARHFAQWGAEHLKK
jgi:hypothetical protein